VTAADVTVVAERDREETDARPIKRARPLIPRLRKGGRSFLLTLIVTCIVAAFLAPMLQSASLSIKSRDQITQPGAPLWPADPQTFDYNGRTLNVYQVPINGETRTLALLQPGRTSSTFIDPADPSAAPITWDGSWRAQPRSFVFAPHFENFAQVWDLLEYPRLLFNTVVIAVVGMIGVLLSCTLVAYGFARFRFPGRNLLFLLLLSTIFLPAVVTTIPTYVVWRQLGVIGSPNAAIAWLPLLLPTFFANAYDVFLMRQYFMTIPREMDEAAALDGAGPFRTLISVIIPQSWPVIIAVGIFHFVYSWNNFFEPLIYLTTQPDLQPLAVGLQRFNGIHSREPSLLQAGTLMTLIIPVLVYIVFQRVFTRGVVITGVER
jgi:multiple sugar transport system permease protein